MFLFALGFLAKDAWASDSLSPDRLELEHLLLSYAEADRGERVLLADTIARLYQRSGDWEAAVRYRREKAFLQEESGSFSRAFYTWKALVSDLSFGALGAVKDDARVPVDSILEEAYVRMVSDAMQAGMKREGIEAAYRFLQSYPEAGAMEKAFVYSNLGSLYMYAGRREESYGLHKKALGLIGETPAHTEKAAWVYRNFSNWFFAEGELDSALFYLLRINPAENPGMDLDFYYNNIACIYAEKGQLDMAFRYFGKALESVNEKGGKSFRKTRILQNLGSIYRSMGEEEEAERYYLEALQLCRELDYYDVEHEILKEYAFLLRDEGRLPDAWGALVSAYDLRDSVWEMENAEAVFNLRNDMELQKLQSELHQAEITNMEKRLTLSVLSFLLFFMLLFLVVLLYRLKKEKVEKRALNQELADKEVLFNDDIEAKNRQIVTGTILSTKKDELLSQIQSEAESLKKALERQTPDKEKHVDRILQLLQQEKVENRWRSFIQSFEETYPMFFSSLGKEASGLTRGEKRLAALLAAGLNAKEIAEMINRTPSSVETFIYRLRKKMGVPADMKTPDYFGKLKKEAR